MLHNVLTHAQCDAAIAALERRKIEPGAAPAGIVPQAQWASAHNLWEAGQPFTDMIDHPMTTAVLREVVAPLLRLETAVRAHRPAAAPHGSLIGVCRRPQYSFIRQQGDEALQMHGGRGGVSFRYQVVQGKISTGLTAVGFSLQDISEEDGGFCCSETPAELHPRPARVPHVG